MQSFIDKFVIINNMPLPRNILRVIKSVIINIDFDYFIDITNESVFTELVRKTYLKSEYSDIIKRILIFGYDKLEICNFINSPYIDVTIKILGPCRLDELYQIATLLINNDNRYNIRLEKAIINNHD